MQWDFRDQLSATVRQAKNDPPPPDKVPETTYYVYDAAGRRARKITERQNGARQNERFYLGGFELYREFSSGGKLALERETLHVMDDKQRIALVETAVGSSAPVQRYQLRNHLGSASLELDETGGLISYEEYSPYGNTTFQAKRSASEVSLKRYRYTGTERDEENGFTYHRTRYYAPWLGRWTSCDPGGAIHDSNLYQYVGSNPMIVADTSGMQGERWDENDLARFERQQGQAIFAYSIFNKENWKVAAKVTAWAVAGYVAPGPTLGVALLLNPEEAAETLALAGAGEVVFRGGKGKPTGETPRAPGPPEPVAARTPEVKTNPSEPVATRSPAAAGGAGDAPREPLAPAAAPTAPAPTPTAPAPSPTSKGPSFPPPQPKAPTATTGGQKGIEPPGTVTSGEASRGPGGGPAPQYLIKAGVRRSVSARELGHQDITARVLDPKTNKLSDPVRIPLDQLGVEPLKATIQKDQRYVNVFIATGQGEIKDPIEVQAIDPTKNTPVVPLGDVRLKKMR